MSDKQLQSAFHCIFQIDGMKVAQVSSVIILTRSDKQPDRVEISPEQLTAAAEKAEVKMRNKTVQQCTRVDEFPIGTVSYFDVNFAENEDASDWMVSFSPTHHRLPVSHRYVCLVEIVHVMACSRLEQKTVLLRGPSTILHPCFSFLTCATVPISSTLTVWGMEKDECKERCSNSLILSLLNCCGRLLWGRWNDCPGARGCSTTKSFSIMADSNLRIWLQMCEPKQTTRWWTDDFLGWSFPCSTKTKPRRYNAIQSHTDAHQFVFFGSKNKDNNQLSSSLKFVCHGFSNSEFRWSASSQWIRAPKVNLHSKFV